MTDPIPKAELTEPVAITVGSLAEALSDFTGIRIDPAATVALIPPVVDTNWYANNASITAANEALWWSLSRPDRIVLTRREIKDTMAELRSMRDTAKSRLAKARRDMMSNKSRSALIDEVAPLATEVQTCEALMAMLRRTGTELETHHARLLYKFQRPVYGPPNEETLP